MEVRRQETMRVKQARNENDLFYKTHPEPVTALEQREKIHVCVSAHAAFCAVYAPHLPSVTENRHWL